MIHIYIFCIYIKKCLWWLIWAGGGRNLLVPGDKQARRSDLQLPPRAPLVEPPTSGSKPLHFAHPTNSGSGAALPQPPVPAPMSLHTSISPRGFFIASLDGGHTAPLASAGSSTFPGQARQSPKIHVPLQGSHKGLWSMLVTRTRCRRALAHHGIRVHYTF